MKKIKLLMPLLGSSALLVAGTTIFTTSCSTTSKYSQYQLTGGDLNLLGDKTGSGLARRAWKVVEENGKETKKSVSFHINVITKLADDESINITVDGRVGWANLSLDKEYKLRVIATITDTETKEEEVRVTDTITIRNTAMLTLKAPQTDEAKCRLFDIDAAMGAKARLGIAGYIKGFEIANIPEEYGEYPEDIARDITVHAEEIAPEGQEKLGTLRAGMTYDYESQSFMVGFASEAQTLEQGTHKVKITIFYDRGGGQLLIPTTFEVISSFEVDTWANVVKYANQGLTALQQHYHVDNFVGLSRTAILNNLKHKVTVIGQNADVDDNNNKLALTFQFDNDISDPSGRGLEVALSGDADNYKDSRMYQALNSGDGFEWNNSDIKYSVYQMLPSDLQKGVKQVKKNSLEFIKDKGWQITPHTSYLFEPAVGSFISYQGFINSDDPKDPKLATDEEKNWLMLEDKQYEYYANLDDSIFPFEYAENYDCFMRRSIKGGGQTDYFLRTPNIHYWNERPGSFWRVYAYGALQCEACTPKDVYPVSPFFCI